MSLSISKTTQWGGSRHKSKPFADPGLLFKCFEKHVDFVKNLGLYESINKSSSPDAMGLVHLLPFAKGLIEISRCAEIHNQSLKAAFSQLLIQNSTVNNSKYNGIVWIGLRIERVGCFLSHFRQLARDQDSLRRCALALTADDFTALKEVVEMIVLAELKPTPEPERGQNNPVFDKTANATDIVPESPQKKPRALKSNLSAVSDVSVDSCGFPRMLDSPKHEPEEVAPEQCEMSFLRQRLGAKANAHIEPSASSSNLRAALGYGSPATVPLPLPALPKATCKSQSSCLAKGPSASSSDRLPWVKLRRCNANNPERSYICGTTSTDDKKLFLIVEVSKNWSLQYMEITDKIFEALQNDAITKQEALDLRKSLCEQYP